MLYQFDIFANFSSTVVLSSSLFFVLLLFGLLLIA